MIDKRELILQRLLVILGAVEGIAAARRNRGANAQNERPALVLVDGDESAVLSHKTSSRAGFAPSIQAMKPGIYILPKSLTPTNQDADGRNIGEITNGFRVAIIEKIAADTELENLLGPNGGISYNGAETDLKSGSALYGEMRLDFTLRYVLNP